MRPTQYGSVEFYTDMFGDLLADVQSDDPATTENIIKGFYQALDSWFDYHEENIIKGFYQALDSWFDYHDKQAREYADIRKRVRQALTV